MARDGKISMDPVRPGGLKNGRGQEALIRSAPIQTAAISAERMAADSISAARIAADKISADAIGIGKISAARISARPIVTLPTIPTTMRAAVYRGVNDVRVETVPVPLNADGASGTGAPLGRGEVLVRIDTCGICGTDLKKIHTGSHSAPRIFGHEMAGTIVMVGDGVAGFEIGDRVMAYHHIPCGKCYYCRKRTYAQCETYKKVGCTAGFAPAGGGFAEYIRGMGATVLTSDLYAERHAIAAKFGLDRPVVSSNDGARGDVVAAAKAASEGRGGDVVVVAVGADALIATAMQAIRPGGRVMLFASTQHGEAPFDPAAVCMDEKTLMGSYSSSVAMNDEVAELVFGGYRDGSFDLTRLISPRFGLEQAVAAIDLASHPAGDWMK